mmetsp:Transcript_95498/g.309441  ORF Transcript_95498/g.309441 Transcript_95498/m.309441 type:complete len:206 (-) Transcript_95498:8-625(-)
MIMRSAMFSRRAYVLSIMRVHPALRCRRQVRVQKIRQALSHHLLARCPRAMLLRHSGAWSGSPLGSTECCLMGRCKSFGMARCLHTAMSLWNRCGLLPNALRMRTGMYITHRATEMWSTGRPPWQASGKAHRRFPLAMTQKACIVLCGSLAWCCTSGPTVLFDFFSQEASRRHFMVVFRTCHRHTFELPVTVPKVEKPSSRRFEK